MSQLRGPRPSARLLQLLTLLQTRRSWSGDELAARLGVTTRTVRRDMDSLRALGYPVHATKGTTGGYRLGAGADLPPLLLDDDEAVAVAVALQTATASGVIGAGETALRALVKLEQVLPARLRHRLRSVRVSTVATPWGTATVDPEVLTVVAAACRDHERLRLDYRDHRGDETTRLTEPHQLVVWSRRWYLVAWDLDRADWRTFRVDRLRPWTPPGPRFTPRAVPGGDAAAFVAGKVADMWPYRATVRLRVPATSTAARACGTYGRIEPVDDDSCLLHVGADGPHGLAFLLGSLEVEFEVRDAPELSEQLRQVADRFRRAAGPPGRRPGAHHPTNVMQ